MWIARDKDGSLWIYENMPVKVDSSADWESEDYFDEIILHNFKEDPFPEVKWEDEEPRELILK